MAVRNSVTDFIRDIGARTNASGSVVFIGSTNADGTVKITRNGVTIFAKVIWPGPSAAAATDAAGAGNNDTVFVQDAGGGYYNAGSAQNFINSLV